MSLDNQSIELAEYLAETYFPHDAIDPIAMASKVGITSSVGHYEDAFDGLLELRERRFHIYVNQDRLGPPTTPRARFTVAHELGHYFIDSHRLGLLRGLAPHPSFTEFQSDYLIERQADEFAANLLMPPRRFAASAKRIESGLAAILKLSELNRTSVMSTAIRYARTDVAPVAVMLWAETERRWCWSATDIWNITQNKAHKLSKNVPLGSLTQQLLSGSSVTADEAQGSILSAWYPFVQSGSRVDHLCREQAIRLGSFGVLTVLTLDS